MLLLAPYGKKWEGFYIGLLLVAIGLTLVFFMRDRIRAEEQQSARAEKTGRERSPRFARKSLTVFPTVNHRVTGVLRNVLAKISFIRFLICSPLLAASKAAKATPPAPLVHPAPDTA